MADETLPDLPKELTKVANNLINKISKAIGTSYEPTHIKRMAKADAAARIIAAQTEIEITDLQRRAAARWLYEEERHQENLEEITRAAIPHLTDDGKADEIDDDWLASFLNHAKKVSDKDMQNLWAKILAGQANAPGSFRKQALLTVSLLEKTDADLFVKLCQFGFNFGDFIPVIFDTSAAIYRAHGLTFEAISHLDDIGLATFNSMGGFSRVGVPRQFNIAYANRAYLVSMPENEVHFPYGQVGHVDRRPIRTHISTHAAPSLPALRCAARLQPWRRVVAT
jgi:hypothetical protein